MFIRYDGSVNYLRVFGKSISTIYGPHMSIERNTGFVGIGDASPSEKLSVTGNITSTGSLTSNSITTGTVNSANIVASGSITSNATTPYLTLNSNSASSTTLGIGFKDQGSNIGWIYYDLASSFLTINADQGVGVRRDLVITSTGNVGIGTQSPAYKFEVYNGDIKSGGDLIATSANGVINAGGAINTLINVIGDSGTPGVVNGDEDLYINGDLEVIGQGFKTGGGSWATISDARLKRDILPFTDGLEQLIQIEPVSFQYNGSLIKDWDNGKRYIGVLAQDIEKIAPYTVEEVSLGREVSENEDGTENVINQGTPYLTYDGSALTYMLINSVKEQQQIIENQNEKIEMLTDRMETLMNMVTELSK